MALKFNPPEWLIQDYMNRKSDGQQLLDSAQHAAGLYLHVKQQQQALASLDAQRKADEFKTVADYVPEAQIPALAKQYGINIPGAPAAQPASPGIQPTAGATPDGSSSPIIDHWNQTMGSQSSGGQAPGVADGQPPVPTGRPTSKAGLAKYRQGLEIGALEEKSSPTPYYDAGSGKKKFDLPPRGKLIPGSGASENRNYIGNDEEGNPLFANKSAEVTQGKVPGGGPVLPKSSTMPTSSTRSSAEFADTIIPHIHAMRDLVKEADKKGYIGPTAGRVYGKFLAGKVGTTGNADADKLLGRLRATDSLLKTGAMRVHFGARGGTQMYDHFSDLLNSGQQSAPMLNGSLDGIESFMQGYSDAGKPKRPGSRTSSSTPAVGQESGPKGPTVTQNGNTYDWNPQTQQYE